MLPEDYRSLRGRYDKLVSIEMIEAVGHAYFDAYFRACSERLAADGRMALQAILIDEPLYERARRTVDFIKWHVFPGGCLPSLGAITRSVARASDLRVVHLEDLTPHYARTLALWRERFVANRAAIRALGYPEALLRTLRVLLRVLRSRLPGTRGAPALQIVLEKRGSRLAPILGELACAESVVERARSSRSCRRVGSRPVQRRRLRAKTRYARSNSPRRSGQRVGATSQPRPIAV